MGEDYALQLNRDAQVNVLETALPLLARGLPRRVRHEPPGALHPHHADDARVRAGRAVQARRRGRAARAASPSSRQRGIEFVVVSGDMIEGTITATLLERANPGAIAARKRDRRASSTTSASSPPRSPRRPSSRCPPTTRGTSATSRASRPNPSTDVRHGETRPAASSCSGPASFVGLGDQAVRDAPAERERAHDLHDAEHDERDARDDEQQHRRPERREEHDDSGDDAEQAEEDRPALRRRVAELCQRHDALDDPQHADQHGDEDRRAPRSSARGSRRR